MHGRARLLRGARTCRPVHNGCRTRSAGSRRGSRRARKRRRRRTLFAASRSRHHFRRKRLPRAGHYLSRLRREKRHIAGRQNGTMPRARLWWALRSSRSLRTRLRLRGHCRLRRRRRHRLSGRSTWRTRRLHGSSRRSRFGRRRSRLRGRRSLCRCRRGWCRSRSLRRRRDRRGNSGSWLPCRGRTKRAGCQGRPQRRGPGYRGSRFLGLALTSGRRGSFRLRGCGDRLRARGGSTVPL